MSAVSPSQKTMCAVVLKRSADLIQCTYFDVVNSILMRIFANTYMYVHR